ncbi:MAG: hypothetical protein PVG22_15215 [Chromatiales bacterium]|jgi:hypothetical protein
MAIPHSLAITSLGQRSSIEGNQQDKKLLAMFEHLFLMQRSCSIEQTDFDNGVYALCYITSLDQKEQGLIIKALFPCGN